MTWYTYPAADAGSYPSDTGQEGNYVLHELINFRNFDGVTLPELVDGDIIRLSTLKIGTCFQKSWFMIHDTGAPDIAGMQLRIGLAYTDADGYPNVEGAGAPTFKNWFCSINVDGSNPASRINIATEFRDRKDLCRTHIYRDCISIEDMWATTAPFNTVPAPSHLDLAIEVVTLGVGVTVAETAIVIGAILLPHVASYDNIYSAS